MFSGELIRNRILTRSPLAAEYNTKAQTDRLQKEIDMLKEQLQLTRNQLESAQHSHAGRFSKVGQTQRSVLEMLQ